MFTAENDEKDLVDFMNDEHEQDLRKYRAHFSYLTIVAGYDPDQAYEIALSEHRAIPTCYT